RARRLAHGFGSRRLHRRGPLPIQARGRPCHASGMQLQSEPEPAPARIVEGDRVATGRFQGPIADPNLVEAPIATPLGLSGRFGRVWRRLRLKEWHYTSVVDDRFLFACAVVHAGYVGSAFAYLVERATGRFFEYATLRPLAAG